MKITRDKDARAGKRRKTSFQRPRAPSSRAPREGEAAGARAMAGASSLLERGRWRVRGGPYLLVLPLLGLSSGARGDGAAQGPAARLTVEVGRADVGWGDGGGGGGEGDEGPAPRGRRLVAVLRGDGGVRPDGGRRQTGGRAGRPQGRHRGGGPLRGRHRGVSCGGRTENG